MIDYTELYTFLAAWVTAAVGLYLIRWWQGASRWERWYAVAVVLTAGAWWAATCWWPRRSVETADPVPLPGRGAVGPPRGDTGGLPTVGPTDGSPTTPSLPAPQIIELEDDDPMPSN